MQALKDLEIGIMFWGGRDPVETLREVKGLGVRCGQIGIPGDMNLGASARGAWKSALAAEQFTLVTVFAAFSGESYADIPTVKNTVGFIPPETRAEREKRTLECSDFAAALGIPSTSPPTSDSCPRIHPIPTTSQSAKWYGAFAIARPPIRKPSRSKPGKSRRKPCFTFSRMQTGRIYATISSPPT